MMQTEQLLTVAMFASVVWAVGASAALCRGGKTHIGERLAYFVASLLAVVASVWMSWVESPGRNHIIFMFDLVRRPDPYNMCAAALGACIGFGPAVWTWHSTKTFHPNSKGTVLCKGATLIGVLGSFFLLVFWR